MTPDDHEVRRTPDGTLEHVHRWPSRDWRPGPRLVAVQRAERIIRELAECRDVGDLRLNGRRLVQQARTVVDELDATSREPTT